MLFHQDSNDGGTLLAAHVTDFVSTQAAWRWRRSARRHLSAAPGLVFAKAMPFIGSGASAGFGGGVPALGRQILLTAWRQETDFERFLEQPLAQRLVAVGLPDADRAVPGGRPSGGDRAHEPPRLTREGSEPRTLAEEARQRSQPDPSQGQGSKGAVGDRVATRQGGGPVMRTACRDDIEQGPPGMPRPTAHAALRLR